MAPPKGGSHNTLVWLGSREGSNVWVDRATVSLLPEEMKAMSASTLVGQGLNPATCLPARMAPQLSLVDFLSSAFCPQGEERFSSKTLARGCPFKARHCMQRVAGPRLVWLLGTWGCQCVQGDHISGHPCPWPVLHGQGLSLENSLNSHSMATKVSPAALSSSPS